MLNNYRFDYIIIGNGLAGFQLALKMASNNFFSNKQIALIDPSNKNFNDKTWSFWETEISQWNAISYKSWNKALVITSKKIHLNLLPYTYKSIRAIDFYNYAKNKLKGNKNIHFIKDVVLSTLETNEEVTVKTKNHTYKALHVFDSRVPEDFLKNSKSYISLIQHFKGYIIKTNKHVFDESKVTMMDYRLKDGNKTTFTYVLPFSKTEALVEFTYFTEETVEEETYNKYLNAYIKDFLKIEDYSIIETENGKIPMSNFPFEKYNTKNITKIGTAGGWVKSSTGYSFKHTEKKVNKIINNIKSQKTPSNELFIKKYRFYDTIFLQVLRDENHKGEWIFERFYSKNSIQTMFKFLDEESSFIEELKIMRSLFSWSFIKAFIKTLKR